VTWAKLRPFRLESWLVPRLKLLARKRLLGHPRRILLPLGLTGAVVLGLPVGSPNTIQLGSDHSSNQHTEVARTPSSSFSKTNASQSEQQVEEVHAAVVDIPKVADLSHASPDTWHTLPPPVQLNEQLPPTSPDLNEIELLKVNSAANIRSSPSASAEIIGIAHAGAEVQVASRDSG
jgi:hypothetical protein